MRKLGFLALTALMSCSESPTDNADAINITTADVDNASPSIVDTESGRYKVEVDPLVDPTTLPMNADLKMVDGDLVKYSLQLCELNFAHMIPDRCEVFVQPDKSGLLVGYAALLQRQNVILETAIETDPQRSGLGCGVSGTLINTDFENPMANLEISKNFTARIGYAAWEKSPGDWMVSTDEDNVDLQGARGNWFVKHVNNKLRISQERWNYCYGDSKIYIDEVFNHAVTLTRVDAIE